MICDVKEKEIVPCEHLKKLFSSLFVLESGGQGQREGERERERERERESKTGSMLSAEPDAGLDPTTLGS